MTMIMITMIILEMIMMVMMMMMAMVKVMMTMVMMMMKQHSLWGMQHKMLSQPIAGPVVHYLLFPLDYNYNDGEYDNSDGHDDKSNSPFCT